MRQVSGQSWHMRRKLGCPQVTGRPLSTALDRRDRFYDVEASKHRSKIDRVLASKRVVSEEMDALPGDARDFLSTSSAFC